LNRLIDDQSQARVGKEAEAVEANFSRGAHETGDVNVRSLPISTSDPVPDARVVRSP
jgi:hypothetical protein